MKALHARAVELAAEFDFPVPSRSTLYELMRRVEGHEYSARSLPEHVRATLYNLDEDATVSGRQLAFSLFSYGNRRALSYGASLPWLDLYQASLMPGWRPMSRSLLRTVLERKRA